MNKGLETNSTLSHYRIVSKIARLRDEIHQRLAYSDKVQIKKFLGER